MNDDEIDLEIQWASVGWIWFVGFVVKVIDMRLLLLTNQSDDVTCKI
jgi:hypothetical protein